jgi:hypothetical protein
MRTAKTMATRSSTKVSPGLTAPKAFRQGSGDILATDAVGRQNALGAEERWRRVGKGDLAAWVAFELTLGIYFSLRGYDGFRFGSEKTV